jgi:hypothetical protein
MRKLVIAAILLSFVAPASARDRHHRVKTPFSMHQLQKLVAQAAPMMNMGDTTGALPMMNMGDMSAMLPMGDLGGMITEQMSQAQERLQDMMR